MKLLMIYTEHFAYQPAVKTLENEPDCTQGGQVAAALIGFIHAESCDEEDLGRVETRLVKNLRSYPPNKGCGLAMPPLMVLLS